MNLPREETILLSGGRTLRAQILESRKKCWLIFTHGIGEHCDRHQYLDDLFGSDFNIFRYDLTGHGKSSGKRAYVDTFSQYAQDLNAVIQWLQAEYRMTSMMLMGHSMGALITAYALSHQMLKIDGIDLLCVYLNAPPVVINNPLVKVLAQSPEEISYLLSSFPMSLNLPYLVNLNHLSHDPQVKLSYQSDPLNSLRLSTKLIWQMVHAARITFNKKLAEGVPTYFSVGSQDRIVSPEAIVKYATRFYGDDFLKVVEGGYHELHLETRDFRTLYFDFLKKCLYSHWYKEH